MTIVQYSLNAFLASNAKLLSPVGSYTPSMKLKTVNFPRFGKMSPSEKREVWISPASNDSSAETFLAKKMKSFL